MKTNIDSSLTLAEQQGHALSQIAEYASCFALTGQQVRDYFSQGIAAALRSSELNELQRAAVQDLGNDQAARQSTTTKLTRRRKRA